MKRIFLNMFTKKNNDDLQTITPSFGKPIKSRVNRKYLLMIGILGLLMSGCMVRSLHPFCFESDIVFREDLLGTYTDQHKGTWTIELKEHKNVNSYKGNFAQ